MTRSRKRVVKTITKAPLKGGGSKPLNWTELALSTATLLDLLPTEPPPSPETVHWVGLLGQSWSEDPRKEWEQKNPEREGVLQSLAIIERMLESYSDTGTVWHDQPDGECLIEAWAMLANVRTMGWVPTDFKAKLPVLIASIARTVSVESSMKASGPRSREPNALRREMLETMKGLRDPTWQELLDQMQGDGVVVCYDAASIIWSDDEDMMQQTAVKTFMNWLTAAKKPI